MENGNDLKECMLKEVDILQDIIRRMASNSFLLKGWCVTLVVGILLLKGPEKYGVVLAFVPLVAFWYLDAYFLRQERLFRKLYDWVIRHRLQLHTDEGLFDMSNEARSDEDFEEEVDSIRETMFCSAKKGKTNTLRLFYGSMAIPLVIRLVYLLVSLIIKEACNA